MKKISRKDLDLNNTSSPNDSFHSSNITGKVNDESKDPAICDTVIEVGCESKYITDCDACNFTKQCLNTENDNCNNNTFNSNCICVSIVNCITENNDAMCNPETGTSGLGQLCCVETDNPANCPIQETTGCQDTEQCMLSIEYCMTNENDAESKCVCLATDPLGSETYCLCTN